MRKPDVQTMPNRIKPPSQRHQFKKILTSVKQLLESVGSKNLRLTCSRKGREGVPPPVSHLPFRDDNHGFWPMSKFLPANN